MDLTYAYNRKCQTTNFMTFLVCISKSPCQLRKLRYTGWREYQRVYPPLRKVYIAGGEEDCWLRVAGRSVVMRGGLAVLLPSVCLVGNVGLFGIPYSAAIPSASLLYMKQDPAAQSEKRGPSKSRAEISTSSKRQRSSGVGSNFAANQLVSIFFFFWLDGRDVVPSLGRPATA